MVIDAHVHCAFFQDVCNTDEALNERRKQYNLHKTGRASFEQQMWVMDFAHIDKSILLPLDLTSVNGKPVISNDEMAKLKSLAPDRWICFAGIDPNRTDAIAELERAFRELKLEGLKLNLSRLGMMPTDPKLKPIYEVCLKYNKPITFHAGLSFEPDAPSRYARPIEYEEVAIEYPDLRFCLAHFGWPWVDETVMLLIKFPNVYTDTSFLYMSTPQNFFQQIFTKNMDPLWLEQNFLDKVMFGSNAPRFRPARMKDGVTSLKMLHKDSMNRILGENAQRFLGWEVKE